MAKKSFLEAARHARDSVMGEVCGGYGEAVRVLGDRSSSTPGCEPSSRSFVGTILGAVGDVSRSFVPSLAALQTKTSAAKTPAPDKKLAKAPAKDTKAAPRGKAMKKIPALQPYAKGLSVADHKKIAQGAVASANKAVATGSAAVAEGKNVKVFKVSSTKPVTAKQKAAYARFQAAQSKATSAAVAAVKAGQAAIDAARRAAEELPKQAQALQAQRVLKPKFPMSAVRSVPISSKMVKRTSVRGSDFVVKVSSGYNVSAILSAIEAAASAAESVPAAPPPDVTNPEIVWDKDLPIGSTVYDGAKGWPSYGFGSSHWVKGQSAGESEYNRQFITGKVRLSQSAENTLLNKLIKSYMATNGVVWFGDLTPVNPLVEKDNSDYYLRLSSKIPSLDDFNVMHIDTLGQGVGWHLLQFYAPGPKKSVDEVKVYAGVDPNDLQKYGGYGPLIGNPFCAGAFDGIGFLRYNYKTLQWFWPPDQAPKWATAAADAAAYYAKKAQDEAARTQAEADQKRQDKIKADQDLEAAAKDYELSLKQKEAEAEKTRATTEQETQDIKAQTQRSEQQVQDDATSSALQKSQIELDQRAQDLDLQAQALQLQWLAQQPADGGAQAPGAPQPEGFAFDAYGQPVTPEGAVDYGQGFGYEGAYDERGVPTPPADYGYSGAFDDRGLPTPPADLSYGPYSERMYQEGDTFSQDVPPDESAYFDSGEPPALPPEPPEQPVLPRSEDEAPPPSDWGTWQPEPPPALTEPGGNFVMPPPGQLDTGPAPGFPVMNVPPISPGYVVRPPTAPALSSPTVLTPAARPTAAAIPGRFRGASTSSPVRPRTKF
jgi:hypothetical protein